MSTICPFPQHRQLVADALAIVLAPEPARPQQRVLAWAALKTARGQRMSQTALGRLQNEQRSKETLLLRIADRIGGAA